MCIRDRVSAIGKQGNIAASPGLRQRLLPCSDNIALLPNGANPQMFLRDGLEPPELVRQLPRPVFARVGDVSADLELAPLVHTAQRLSLIHIWVGASKR